MAPPGDGGSYAPKSPDLSFLSNGPGPDADQKPGRMHHPPAPTSYGYLNPGYDHPQQHRYQHPQQTQSPGLTPTPAQAYPPASGPSSLAAQQQPHYSTAPQQPPLYDIDHPAGQHHQSFNHHHQPQQHLQHAQHIHNLPPHQQLQQQHQQSHHRHSNSHPGPHPYQLQQQQQQQPPQSPTSLHHNQLSAYPPQQPAHLHHHQPQQQYFHTPPPPPSHHQQYPPQSHLYGNPQPPNNASPQPQPSYYQPGYTDPSQPPYGHHQPPPPQQQPPQPYLQGNPPPPASPSAASPGAVADPSFDPIMPPRKAPPPAPQPEIMESPVRTKFPTARIKRIMQADEEVGKVAQQTPIAVGKALELFMVQLVNKSAEVAREKGSKRITAHMLKQAVDSGNEWDFLQDIVAKVSEKDESKGGRAAKAETPESDEDFDVGEPKKKGRGGRKKKAAA